MKKLLLASCILLFAIQSIASPSNLDTSFNKNGITTSLIPNTLTQAQAMVVQPDGKIINAGYAGDNAVIVRFNNDGTLDHHFNPNGSQPGMLPITLGTTSAAYAVALQPNDQKIVIAGWTTTNNINNAFVARFYSDGTLDTSFNDPNNTNSGGYITSNFQGQSQLFGLALEPHGNIVVTGWVINNYCSNALVARYTSSGALDNTFNGTGYVKTLLGTVFTKGKAINLQANGNIIVAGQAELANIQQIVVLSYSPTGTLQSSFTCASATPPLNSCVFSIALGLAIQADQKIVIVGSANETELGFQSRSYTVIRLEPNLTLDTSFNSAQTPGYILSDIGLQANDVVIQQNEQIVTCGFDYSNQYMVIVVRYNNDGTIDPTFNFVINNLASNSLGNALALQLDGKIVVSGAVGTNSTQL